MGSKDPLTPLGILNQNRIQGVYWPLDPHATAEGTKLLGRVKTLKWYIIF